MAKEPSSLALLTEERIKNAFKKTLEVSEPLIDGGKFTLITPDLYDAVKTVGNEGFTKRDPLSLATGMVWEGPTADTFWEDCLKQGVSIAIINDDRDIMAIRVFRFMRIDVQPYDTSKIENEAERTCFTFLVNCDQKAKFSERYQTDEIVHFAGLVVPEKYSRRGYGSRIMEFVMKFLKNLNLGKDIFIKSEATSNYSKRIYEKLGFSSVYEQPFDEYVVNGERVIQDTGEHTSMVIYGMCLKSDRD